MVWFLGSGPVGDDDLWHHHIGRFSPFLGSGPGRGRSPVEWGEIPSVRPFVRSSVPPPWGLPAGSEGLPAGFGALPAGFGALPAGSKALPAGSEAHPAQSEALPALQIPQRCA